MIKRIERRNFIKVSLNSKFSTKFILVYGICLGGHMQLLKLTTSSSVFGLRTQNLVINSNLTSIELAQMSSIIEGLGCKRCVIYFINSILSFRVSFKFSYSQYNRHLFFPIRVVILNLLRKFKLLLISKKDSRKVRRSLKFKKRFFLKSGKNILRKVFIASRWRYGFVSNSRSFYIFADNVVHEKVKVGKILNSYEEQLKTFVDFYPFLPNYGFIGDHRQNYWIVNEFKMARVPNVSIIDPLTTKALFSMYGLPGNACSIDATLFFLVLTISTYLVGFYQQVLQFCLTWSLVTPINMVNKKHRVFKKFIKIKLI